MTTFTFAIEDGEHSFEYEPLHGDPNTLFTDGQSRIVDEIQSLGYRFIPGAEPEYQELTKAYRTSSNKVDLGDLTDRVEPDQPPEEDEDETVLELVGPDMASQETAFGKDQNVGAVAAAISDRYGVELDEQVVLYPTAEREDALQTDTRVEDLSTQQLHWSVDSLEEGS